MPEDKKNVVEFKQPQRQSNGQNNTPKSTPPSEPILNLPPFTKVMIGLFLGLHALFYFSANFGYPALSYWVYDNFAFVPAKLTEPTGINIWAPLSLITYAFLHGGWLHVGMNSLMMLALGAGFEKVMGAKNTALLFFGASLLAAVLHLIFAPASSVPVVGASGGIGGLFGGLLYLLYKRGQLGNLRNFKLALLVFIGVSIIFGLLGGPGGAAIAWIAHIGGFLGGVLITYFIMKKSGA